MILCGAGGARDTTLWICSALHPKVEVWTAKFSLYQSPIIRDRGINMPCWFVTTIGEFQQTYPYLSGFNNISEQILGRNP